MLVYFSKDKVSSGPNCPFSKEAAVKRPRRKRITGQFLWSNGLGDWPTNLKQGPSSVRIRGAVD